MNDERLRRRGDSRARSELAERYLPLARSLALRYRHTQEPIEDLMQVASLGLVKAIDRWDPERGTPFTSFAVPTILGELRRHFRDCTWMVRPPRALQELALQVMRARTQLWTAEGREPTVGDLAGALGRPLEAIVDAVAAAEGRHALSLDAPAADGDESTPQLDLLGDADAALAAVDDRLFADHLVKSLDSRARAVLRMRFELDLRQWEIADRVGVSQMHVSRILRDALATLHRHATGITPRASRAAPA
ncbi:MAG TPA: sigma-70 family RNA polymerase sigma factor [Solirubrobacteraceae bacterium]|nr:sigma-70 family RNA polymerase sigma factor [Solirubrobacteraceae bacterium]